MRVVRCASCGVERQSGLMYVNAGRILCGDCAARALERAAAVHAPVTLAPLIDDTVCRRCGADNGLHSWPYVSGLATCPQCAKRLFAPFPLWLRASAVLLFAMLVFALVRGMPFFAAGRHVVLAERAAERGDFEAASALYEAVLPLRPSAEGLVLRAADAEMRAGRPTQAQGFLRLRDEFTGDSLSAAVLERWRRVLVASHLADSAVAAESAGDRTAAVQLLGRARTAYPESRVIALLMFGLQAKDAWAQRDWSALVRIDSALFALLPRQPFAAINLADAYAAMYAATGDTVARAAAERLLGAARLMAAWSPAQRPALDLAVQRVRYRLATRQILSAEEYAHRFPVTGSSRR